MFAEPNEFHYGILRLPVNSGTARHVREMANTRGKSLSQEGERRLVESLRAARLRLFDTPTSDILRRLFGEHRLVNGAPQRRRSSVEGGSTYPLEVPPASVSGICGTESDGAS